MPYDKDIQGNKVESKTSIFVKGFSKEWTHKELFDFFKDFGDIVSSKVSLNENHLSRGYGFVQFSKEDSVLKAIESVRYFMI